MNDLDRRVDRSGEMLQRMEIEDDSDCASCILRNAQEWRYLTTVKMRILCTAPCEECGRTVTLWTPEGTEP